MTHRKLTASGLPLAQACPAAYALPAVEEHETPAMRAGTERHAWLDVFANAWMLRAAQRGAILDARADATVHLPVDPTARSTCERIDLEALLAMTGGDVGQIETSVRVQWWPESDSAEELTPGDHRSYPEAPNALHGTTDWVVTAPSGAVTVVDFKGSHRGAPAAEHAQIAFYALALARARGLDTVRVLLVYLHEDGSLHEDAAALGPWELDGWAARLRDTHARVTAARAGAPGDHARVGDHCGRCPALRICPAQVALARELALAPPSPEALPALSDEDAGSAWARLDLLEEILKRARAALRVRAERRGLPLPDGRWLIPTETTRRSLDVTRALAVLGTLVPPSRVEALVERSLATGVVDDLARELAAASGEPVRDVTARTWAALREARAVREATVVQLRPRKRGPDGA